jgi:hypothetical protein
MVPTKNVNIEMARLNLSLQLIFKIQLHRMWRNQMRARLLALGMLPFFGVLWCNLGLSPKRVKEHVQWLQLVVFALLHGIHCGSYYGYNLLWIPVPL